MHEVCERDFRVESNLPHLTSLDEITRHMAIERALLAVGGLNQRLADMNGYNALTDFWYRDLPVLGSKFRYFRELGPVPNRNRQHGRLGHDLTGSSARAS